MSAVYNRTPGIHRAQLDMEQAIAVKPEPWRLTVDLYRPKGCWDNSKLSVRADGSLFVDASLLDRRISRCGIGYIGVTVPSSRTISKLLGNLAANRGFTVTDDDMLGLADKALDAVEQLLK